MEGIRVNAGGRTVWFDRWNRPVANECPNCDLADSILAAYRHAMKDAVRAENWEEARTVLMKAMDNENVNRMGKVFHKLVKAGFGLAMFAEHPESAEFKGALSDLKEYVAKMERGGTVRGWIGERRLV